MSTDRDLLPDFVNGTLYWRIVSFEVGPDLFHLFRSRIVNVYLPGDGTITFEEEDIFPNRFTCEKWIDNPTKPGPRSYDSHTGLVRGERVTLPIVYLISPEVIYLRLTMTIDGIIYRNPQEAPEMDPMRDFAKTNYERLFEALSKQN